MKVTSKNQHGGITAGIVNLFNKTKIELSDENKQQLTEYLIIKNDTVHISLQVGGGSALVQLSEDIKAFLIQQGYTNVLGVHTIMGFSPFKGVILEKKPDTESVVFIGSLS